MRNIGLFAGAFDPIHDGHIEVARASVNQLSLDMLYFMVESRPWGDKQPVELKHRQTMLDLSTEADEKLALLSLPDDQFSIDRTLAELEEKFPEDELFFVFGGDVFMHMNPEQWPGLEKLFKHYIVVFERGMITEKEISRHAKSLGIATAIIPSMYPRHSSTDVRLRPHDKAVWVSKQVADYIDNNKLY
jgi:nicotinate-nucleotide adenylyltransferase